MAASRRTAVAPGRFLHITRKDIAAVRRRCIRSAPRGGHHVTVKMMSACLVGAALAVSGCSQKPGQVVAAAPATPKIGIHPFGTGEPDFKPDYSKLPPELQKVFTHIDTNIDEHAQNIQKWIQQPSISNSGEGIPESAEMVKGFFEKLGCQNARVYDTGLTEYGSQGNPVVY